VEGKRDAEALLRGRRILLASVVCLAGCGKSRSAGDEVDASCKRQRAAIAALGPVESLPQAKRALRKTISLETRALDDLGRADELAGVAAVRARLRVALADARRFQASIENVDPTQSMTPLQVGPSGARRAVERAKALALVTCRLGRTDSL
jgi:hypothetical protein